LLLPSACAEAKPRTTLAKTKKFVGFRPAAGAAYKGQSKVKIFFFSCLPDFMVEFIGRIEDEIDRFVSAFRFGTCAIVVIEAEI